MAKLPGIYELMATAASPAINFGRGLLGYQDPFTTQTMRDRMAELEAEKGPTGNVGYEDYGLQTATPGGRFTGGLMGLALNNPVDFGLAGSIGRYSYGPEGRTGLTYDFTPDQDTGSTGSATLDFINRGGLKGALSRMGTAQAAEVTPQNEPMDIEDFLGTSTPQDLGFIDNAPQIKEAIYQDRIMNPNLPGFRVEPSRFQSFKNQVSNQISGLKDFMPFGPKSLTGMAARGIGSMLSNIAPRSYGYSQRTYDAMTPSQQEFVDDLYDPGGLLQGYNKISAFGRGPLGTLANRLGTIQNTLAKQKVKSKVLQQREQQISNAINETINRGEREALQDRNRSVDYGITGGPTRTDIDVADGGAESGGRSKIVCTMMNERYGFGSFRNKIWMKFHENHGPEYQKGYHAIFLPLVKIAKGEGKINTAVRKVLEHMGRHVTADMFKIMKGKKRDPLGRIYRAIFEPTCRIIGKIKSALGRG